MTAYTRFTKPAMKGGITADMSTRRNVCDTLIAIVHFKRLLFTVDGLTGEGMTWSDSPARFPKTPKGMVIENGAYVGM